MNQELTVSYNPDEMKAIETCFQRELSISRALEIALEKGYCSHLPIEQRAVFICEWIEHFAKNS